MKKENEGVKSGYLLYCDGTKCKQCLDAFVCQELRGLDEKDIQKICDNTEMKIMRALPQNMRDFAARYKKDIRAVWTRRKGNESN